MGKKTVSPASQITFGALRLDQAVFEVRCYNQQILLASLPDYWDAVEDRIGKDVVYTVNEGSSVCTPTRSQQLSVAQDRFHVAEFFPEKSLASFLELSKAFYETTIAQLRTERITRVGFRLIYSLDFDSPTSVAKAFLNLPYVGVPEGLSFSENGKPLVPTYFLGWNYGEKVIVYRLKGNTSKISVDLPPQLALLEDYPERIEKAYNQFVFDVDVFTTVVVPPGELIPTEWLGQAYEVVKKDGERLFANSTSKD